MPQIDHAAADAAHASLPAALANKALRLQQPDAAQRPGFDRDYGSYAAHPMDPRTPEPGDDELSDDEARDQATDQVLATPHTMAQWLASECDGHREPVDLGAVNAYALLAASVPTLLAVLLAGDNQQALRALHRLRDLAAGDHADEIEHRTRLLLAFVDAAAAGYATDNAGCYE